MFVVSGSTEPAAAFAKVSSCRIVAFRSLRSVSTICLTRSVDGLLEALDLDDARRRRLVVAGALGLELEVLRQHLLHQQRRGDGLEHVVHRHLHLALRGVGLGDQVGELGVLLAGAVAGDAADDLDDLGQRRPVADGEGVLGERPVEALLRHPEREDHVHGVPILRGDRGEVVQGVGALLLVRVVDEVGQAQDRAGVGAADADDPGVGVGGLDVADRVDDEPDLLDLVLRGLARVHVRDVDDRLLVQVEDLADRVGVAALVEVVADAERLQVLVAVELVVVVERDRREPRLVLGRQHRHRVAAEVRARSSRRCGRPSRS